MKTIWPLGFLGDRQASTSRWWSREVGRRIGTIAGALLLLGFALLAYWADVTNARAHRDQRALERARTRRTGP